MGSEMCIRDRWRGVEDRLVEHDPASSVGLPQQRLFAGIDTRDVLANEAASLGICLLYTSDAADERSSVDLGGRRIIKKKKRQVIDELSGLLVEQ